jgi:hypothetical protein
MTGHSTGVPVFIDIFARRGTPSCASGRNLGLRPPCESGVFFREGHASLPQLIGLILVVALVFGGLVFTGGHMAMEALPLELALIGGAAVGTLVIGNSPAVAKEAGAGVLKAFTGAKWRQEDYQSLLVLLGTLMRKARRGGFVSIEADIESPMESETFAAAPDHPRRCRHAVPDLRRVPPDGAGPVGSGPRRGAYGPVDPPEPWSAA